MTLAPAQWILAALIAVFYIASVWYLRRSRRRSPATCKDGHWWRTIAQPYARQCRRCGATQFREDDKGGFPDGLPEYFAYVAQLSPEEKKEPPPQHQCHCGAQMVFKATCAKCGGPMIFADDNRTGRIEVWYCRTCDRVAKPDELPIWLCEICGSWVTAYPTKGNL